jgi:hypothetical protein
MSYRTVLLATTIHSDSEFNWRPGIGDPTVGGWVTVVLYVLATLSFRAVAKRLRQLQAHTVREYRIWHWLFLLYAALGVNKQLDLQTALTELGRMIAHDQGWYDVRGAVQLLFVCGVGITAVVVGVRVLYWAMFAPVSAWIALLGTLLVVTYVMIRAASFHHVDRFITQRALGGLRWNWVLEMGGICLAWLGGFLRNRQLAKVPRPPVRATAVQQRVQR